TERSACGIAFCSAHVCGRCPGRSGLKTFQGGGKKYQQLWTHHRDDDGGNPTSSSHRGAFHGAPEHVTGKIQHVAQAFVLARRIAPAWHERCSPRGTTGRNRKEEHHGHDHGTSKGHPAPAE